jgi:hypothetical protein
VRRRHVTANPPNAWDRYLEYDMLVGEADGGTPLPPGSYKQLQAPTPPVQPISRDCFLQERAAACYQDKLFVTWRNASGTTGSGSSRCVMAVILHSRGRLPQRWACHPLHLQAQLPRAPLVGAAVEAGGLQGAGLPLPLLLLCSYSW